MHQVEVEESVRAHEQGIPVLTVTMIIKTGPNRRRYNHPLQDEVAAIFTSFDGAADIPHDIVVNTHSNQLRCIHSFQPTSLYTLIPTNFVVYTHSNQLRCIHSFQPTSFHF